MTRQRGRHTSGFDNHLMLAPEFGATGRSATALNASARDTAQRSAKSTEERPRTARSTRARLDNDLMLANRSATLARRGYDTRIRTPLIHRCRKNKTTELLPVPLDSFTNRRKKDRGETVLSVERGKQIHA